MAFTLSSSLTGGGSPLKASGSLAISIKMPKQIRWWSMLSLGDWKGHQQIIQKVLQLFLRIIYCKPAFFSFQLNFCSGYRGNLKLIILIVGACGLFFRW